MGFAEIIGIIKTVLQFPTVILEFVKLIQKTPQENHDSLLKAMQKESEQLKSGGRPTW